MKDGKECLYKIGIIIGAIIMIISIPIFKLSSLTALFFTVGFCICFFSFIKYDEYVTVRDGTGWMH